MTAYPEISISKPVPARPGFFRRLFRLKTLVRLLFVFLALITLWAVLCAVENWRGKRAWEAYRAQAEARGTKLKMTDYLPPAIPDEENFAMTPIFQNALKRHLGEKVGRPAMSVWTSPLSTASSWDIPSPGLGSMEKNERLDLAKWRDYLLACGHLEKAGENPAADILLALSKADPEITALHEAAKRPGSRFPVRWEDGFHAALPHLGEIRSTQKLLRLRVAADLALGQHEQAMTDARLMFRMVAALEREPVLITGLVKIAALNEMHLCIWDGLAGKQWREPDLREIQGKLAGTNQLAAYQFSLGSERVGMNTGIDSLMSMGGREKAQLMQIMGGSSNAWSALVHILMPKGTMYFNKIKINEYFDASLARIDLAQGRINAESDPRAMTASLHKGTFTTVYYALFNTAIPALGALDVHFLFAHTRQQQAMLACALERYRMSQGVFPEKLESLVPHFLTAIPIDAMDGQAMQYRRESDGGYKLWGIGNNGKDDQGLLDPIKSSPRDQPDWVWSMPGK